MDVAHSNSNNITQITFTAINQNKNLYSSLITKLMSSQTHSTTERTKNNPKHDLVNTDNIKISNHETESELVCLHTRFSVVFSATKKMNRNYLLRSLMTIPIFDILKLHKQKLHN